MDLRALAERRDLNSGFGDSLARAFEIVFTPFVFGVFGWWIDGRTGTRPLFALTLGVLVKDASWVERAPLFVTLLVTHLGLLLWETRSVSLSLAYPGLKPKETTAR